MQSCMLFRWNTTSRYLLTTLLPRSFTFSSSRRAKDRRCIGTVGWQPPDLALLQSRLWPHGYPKVRQIAYGPTAHGVCRWPSWLFLCISFDATSYAKVKRTDAERDAMKLARRWISYTV